MKKIYQVGPLSKNVRAGYWFWTIVTGFWVSFATTGALQFISIKINEFFYLILFFTISWIYAKWVFAHIYYDHLFYWKVENGYLSYIDPNISKREKNHAFHQYLKTGKPLAQTHIALDDIERIKIYRIEKLSFYGLMAYPTYMKLTLKDGRCVVIHFFISKDFKEDAKEAITYLKQQGIVVENPHKLI